MTWLELRAALLARGWRLSRARQFALWSEDGKRWVFPDLDSPRVVVSDLGVYPPRVFPDAETAARFLSVDLEART